MATTCWGLDTSHHARETRRIDIAHSVKSIARSVDVSLRTAFGATVMTHNPIPSPVLLPREAQFVTTLRL